MPARLGSKRLSILGSAQYTPKNPSSRSFYDSIPGTRNFVVPAGVFTLNVRLWGAGGSGGMGNGATFAGGGAGSGAYQEKVSIAVTPGQLISYTVAARGPSQTTSNTAGTAGGNTSVTAGATTYTCNGGGAGNVLTGGTAGTNNGLATTNTAGNAGATQSGGIGGAGGNSPGILPQIAEVNGIGGPTNSGTTSSGTPGKSPGAGGSGASQTGTSSGEGADGAVYFYW